MRKPILIGTSPLTNTIYAGHILKDGRTWGANKQDVTGIACNAVAEHVLGHKGSTTVYANGKPVYKITVEKL